MPLPDLFRCTTDEAELERLASPSHDRSMVEEEFSGPVLDDGHGVVAGAEDMTNLLGEGVIQRAVAIIVAYEDIGGDTSDEHDGHACLS